MKKILFVLFAVAVFFASCSKEAKLNKRLDGKWNVTTYNAAALPAGMTMVISFAKDKKGKGTYTTTTTAPGLTQTDAGSYELEDDVKITMTSTNAGSTPTVMTINSYSKTDMKITDKDSKVYELKKQ